MPGQEDVVPEADAAEQRESDDGLPDDGPPAPPSRADEGSEADLAEQATPVETIQAVLPAGPHGDVDEADWLDQNVVELDPDDDERR